MKTAALLLLAALAALPARADSITNRDRVYRDIALVTGRCDAAGITFTHKAGVARLDYMELSEEDRLRFGFDAERYRAFKEEERRLKEQAPAPAAPAPPSPFVGTPSPEPPAAPPPEARVVRKVVVITNSAAPVRPFSTPPVTTLMPDNDKMNEARLKAIQKAMELNSRAPRGK